MMSSTARSNAVALLPLAWLAAGCPTQAVICAADSDCPADQLCVDQTCRHTCNVTIDCETGERCLQGYCMPGGDAAVTDSAAADTQAADRSVADGAGADQTATDRSASDRADSDRAVGDSALADSAVRCDDSYCSAHGECWVSGSNVICQCAAGYAQPRCTACASGYQDNDSNGSCLPDCAHTGLDCAQPHTRCSDGDGVAGCDCVVGYADSNGICEWTGGPVDPGFQQTTGWSVEGNATVDTSAAGVDDPGRGYFPQEAACAGGGALVQTIQMPALADAENLALRFWMRSQGFALECLFAKLVVVVNGGEYSYWLPGSTWTRKTICLGARAYGGPLAIRFEVADACSTCNPSGWLGGTVPTFEVDNALIEPAAAGECPDVGTIVNPDFELGPIGWTASASDGGSAGVVEGVGTGGSRGGQLATSQVCAQATLDGRASLPLAADAPSYALQLRSRGDLALPLALSVNRSGVSQLVGTGAFVQQRVCLLDAFKGLAVDLGFSFNASGATCGDPGVFAFAIDDLSLVSEAACPAGARIFDPRFENQVGAPQLAPSWTLSGSSGGTANLVESAFEAHSGNVAAQLAFSAACGYASASTQAIIPGSDAGDGPAIKIWYRAPTLDQAQLYFGQVLAASANWTQAVQCLDPARAGRIASVAISLSDTSGSACGSSHSAAIAWIDDVEVTTDPGCPP